MDSINIFDFYFNQAIVIGVSTLRIAVAFMLVPLFSQELIPATIRNAMFISLAMIVVLVQPPLDLESLSLQGWLSLFSKEVFIGIAIGVFFGIHLWAFEAAGQVIDIQIGASTAQIFDPISGHQTSLIGEFLGRLANYIFMAVGGLMLLVGATLETYAIWPIGEAMPSLAAASVILFEEEFSYFFKLILLISAPVLVVVFLIDVVMGMINRYAQQFNVFFLSMSLKMFAAIFVMSLSLIFIVELIINELIRHNDELLNILNRLLS